MSITLPTDFQGILEEQSGKCDFVVAYELELTAATLYYSDQSFTWNSNDYTPLAVRSSAIVHDMRPTVAPSCTVTFDNVSQTLQSQLTSDLITERFMTIRLLLRQGGSLLAGSIVLLRGLMQKPQRVMQDTLEIQVLGPLHGSQAPMPGSRRFGRQCEWPYANGGAFDGSGDCPYVSSTTATNTAAAPSTALTVASGSNLEDGEEIRIENVVGDGTQVGIASGGGTAAITLDEATTWTTGDDVRLVNCTHEYPNCIKRVVTYRYGGIRGVDDQGRIADIRGEAWMRRNSLGAPGRAFSFLPARTLLNPSFWTNDIEEQPLEERTAVVPIIFGRRLIDGKLIELLAFSWTSYAITASEVAIYALSEGKISEVVDFYTDEGRGNERIINSGGQDYKLTGYYYRAGGDGTEDNETEAEYEADMTTSLRATQNRDLFSGTQDPLHGLGYATFLNLLGQYDQPLTTLPQWDVKGILCQKYTAADTPTTDGAAAWSQNPVWQITEALVSRWGLGKHLTTANISFPTTQPEALQCDTTTYGNYTDVVGTTNETGSYDVWEVDDTAQFTRGMGVEVDENGATTSATVTNVWSSTRMRLSYAKQNPTAPAKIRPEIPRYTSNLYLHIGQRAARTIEQLLNSCAGYVTYDDEGRIEIRTERVTDGPVCHFKDAANSPSQGYKILENDDQKLEWLQSSVDAVGGGGLINRVVLNFENQEQARLMAAANDWDHRAGNDVISRTIDAPGVDNSTQAYRLCKLELDKHRVLNDGAKFVVGPIGVQLQPGDSVTVTADEPNWSSVEKRVVRREVFGLGDSKELMCRLTLADYDESIYSDDPAPEFLDARSGADDEPTVTLSVTSVPGKILLSWVFPAGVRKFTESRVWKSDATMTNPMADGEFVADVSANTSYDYVPTEDELGSTLYFIVTVKIGLYQNLQRISSNEVSAVVIDTDPTSLQYTPGINSITDSGFTNSDDGWTELAPSTAESSPNASSDPGFDGTFADVALAYDNNNATYAYPSGTAEYLTNIEGDDINYARDWFFVVGGSATEGRWRVLAELDQTTIGPANNASLWYSDDNAVTFNQWVSVDPDAGPTNYFSPIHYVKAKTDLQVRANVFRGEFGAIRLRVYEIDWIANTAPWGVVANGVVSLKSDGVTDGEVSREIWQAQAVNHSSGNEWVIQIFAVAEDDIVAGKVINVILKSGDTEYTLLQLDDTNVLSTWRRYAALWTVPADLTGPYQIILRTDSTKSVKLAYPMFTPGTLIYGHGYAPGETNIPVPFPYGSVGVLTAGAWTGTDYTDQIRIAEVT
jgi:hypothetical protein